MGQDIGHEVLDNDINRPGTCMAPAGDSQPQDKMTHDQPTAHPRPTALQAAFGVSEKCALPLVRKRATVDGKLVRN